VRQILAAEPVAGARVKFTDDSQFPSILARILQQFHYCRSAAGNQAVLLGDAVFNRRTNA
jgi:hypothetical protein